MHGDAAARRRNVVITGGAGLIGRVLLHGLRDRYLLTAVDRRSGPDPLVRRANLTRARATEHALATAEVVVDLAAVAASPGTWSDVYDSNMRVTRTVFEAALRAGARRIVFASSNHVTGSYEHDPPYSSIVRGDYEGLDPEVIPLISADDPIRPDGAYGVGKAFGEALGRMYVDVHGLSVICLRIGTVLAADRPTSPRHYATLLTHRDLVQLVGCCIDAPEDLRFAIFYGVSDNRWRFWDLEAARRLVGYEPADDAEQFRH